jgi:hypothetical protein
MASYTTSLRLVQPATGEYSGTWGTQVNNGLTALVDTSVAGTASITMTAANYTLSNNNGASDEARAMFLVLGGTPGASYQVICPAVSKLYFVTNSTGHAQTVKTSAGSGISVPNGASMTLRCNGTDVVVAQNYFGSLTLGAALPVASGGTGAATLTGYVKGAGTSAFTASATIPVADLSGTLPVGNGGTGATTLTGVLKGNGASAFSAAVAGTDYVTPTGSETLTNKTLTNPSVNNYTEGVVAIGAVTTSHTLVLTSGTVQTATLTASTACTFTMPTATAGKSFVLLLKQAASTGNGSATFTGVKWSALGAPTITLTAGKMDILSFVSDGTNWYGSYAQGYTP